MKLTNDHILIKTNDFIFALRAFIIIQVYVI